MTFINKKIAKIVILVLLCAVPIIAQQTKYELKKVAFTGNSYLNSKQLAEVCISKESPGWFSKFLNTFTSLGSTPVYFDSLNVPLDIEIIKDMYKSVGYCNVYVKPQYSINKADESAELEYFITENKPFHIRKYEVTGLERLPADLQRYLQNEIIIDTTEQYSTEMLLGKKTFIRSYLNNNGYMDVSDPVINVELDTLQSKVDVKMNFDTKGRFKISEIKVNKTGAGKDLVDDSLIKEIFGIKPDTYYNQYENTKAQLRLWRTDLFESIELGRGTVDAVNSLVPLEINGVIAPMHELSPEIIGNNEEDELNLGLALSFIKKNFLGDARKMTITATAATKNFDQIAYTDLRAGFEQPYLFGSQIRPRLETYFTNQLWKDKYDAIFYGTKLNLDFESELTPYTFVTSFSVFINWEYSRYIYERAYLLSRFKDAGKEISETNLGDRTTFSGDNAVIGLVFGRDKTNRIFFPTEGYSASLVLEDGNSFLYLVNRLFSSQFSRPLYLKTVFNISNYLPLWDKNTTVLGIKLKAGSIFTYRGNKADIPVNNRFYAGGSNSIRGWKSRDLVPNTVFKDVSQNEDIEAILKDVFPGGYYLFEGAFEFRAKLSEFIAAAAFLDYGNTWNEFKDISIQNIAVSTGLGIRFYTGFVPPIRFDFGFKLYDPYKRKMDLNKTIGDLFKENFEIQFGIGEAF